MELTARVNRKQFILNYIDIFSGSLKLSNKEKEFLYELLDQYLILQSEGLQEPYIGKLVFSKESLSLIKEKLGISSMGLFNYKSSLIKKKVIIDKIPGLQIDPRLVPQTELTFRFIVNE